MDHTPNSQDNLRPVEIHHADISLDNSIQEILNNCYIGKKEKKKLLTALQDQSCNAHLRSHVHYYLDTLQTSPSKILLDLLSIIAVVVFITYAAIRLIHIL